MVVLKLITVPRSSEVKWLQGTPHLESDEGGAAVANQDLPPRMSIWRDCEVAEFWVGAKMPKVAGIGALVHNFMSMCGRQLRKPL